MRKVGELSSAQDDGEITEESNLQSGASLSLRISLETRREVKSIFGLKIGI